MTLFDLLKNILLLLILLQVAPTLIDGIQKQYGRYVSPKTQVGLLTIQGDLHDSTVHSRHLQTFFKNNEIKALLIKIDCSDGAPGSSQSLHDEIKALKRDYPKPIIVLVENRCTAAGYYLASAADYLIAPGLALIGGIGTHLFKEKELPQELLDDSYQQFIADVANNRNLSIGNAKNWADGKLFSGRQAKNVGLIDALGSVQLATQLIKERAFIEGEIEWVQPPRTSWFFSMLFGIDPSPPTLIQPPFA